MIVVKILKNQNPKKSQNYFGDMVADLLSNKILKNQNPKKSQNYFGDMIADLLSNKKLKPIVTELFVKVRKLNTSLLFVT